MPEIICADALPWLADHPGLGAIVTSLPDAAEMGWDQVSWSSWFYRAATACLIATAPTAPTIFYQTDRKADGHLTSKAFLLMRAAHAAAIPLLWHKIVLRRQVGMVDLHRPGYTHLLAFSRQAGPGPATPDVIAPGRLLYPNAMNLTAAIRAVTFARRSIDMIIDPFCGRGTVPAVAETLGCRAIGIDIDPDQCAAARSLRLSLPTIPTRAGSEIALPS